MTLAWRFRSHVAILADILVPFRTFCIGHALHEKSLPPRLVIPETDILESFLKGSGPGGQKINKTSSAVQLKHVPTGIVVKSQETRSRQQNRKIARRILSEKLEEMEQGAGSRTALKAEGKRKKKASASKKARRKYRKLGEQDDPPGDAAATDGSLAQNCARDEKDSVENSDTISKASLNSAGPSDRAQLPRTASP